MKIKLLFIISILSNFAFGQFTDKSELKTVTKEMIAMIKKYSLVKDSTNWDEFNNQITKDIDNIQTIDSSDYILSKIFNTLEKYGDSHSQYMHKTFFEDTFLSPNKSIPLPTSKLLENNIGYLYLPSHRCADTEVNYLYADTLKNQIQFLDENYHITGWIIDLRTNRGGNMWPMLAGLNPIIEDNIIAYLVSDKSSIKLKLKSKAKRPPRMPKMNNNYKCKDLNNKIAVLIDTLTASSGEMAAISLLGMENSRSFGHRSRGATTMPVHINLSNGSYFFLATRYFMDRNKKIYREHINPDIVVDNDNIIQEAIKWIIE